MTRAICQHTVLTKWLVISVKYWTKKISMRTMEMVEISIIGEAVIVSRTVIWLGLAEDVCIEVVKILNAEDTDVEEDWDEEES